MDTGMDKFAEISPSMAELLKSKTLSSRVFEVGEQLIVKDSQFKIEKIGTHTMTLRLIPDNKYQQIPR